MVRKFFTTLSSIPQRTFVWFAVLAAASLSGYLILSASGSGAGFPLDDAWIHQTYARNLASRGEWAFYQGETSAGSTSPLWVSFLSIGYLVQANPVIFSAVLGWACMVALAWAVTIGFRAILPDLAAWGPVVGLLLLLEWHLVWAAASGMETLLAGLVVTVVLVWLLKKPNRWYLVGILIGLGVWIRPDLITLAAPAGLVVLLSPNLRSRKAWDLVGMLAGCLIPAVFYFLFNNAVGGTLLPNTFYAKQVEYRILQEIPILDRYLAEFSLPLVGVGVVLLPGFCYLGWLAVRRRRWDLLVGVGWWFGYVGLYAWRLPVTYQHGRYLIPAMPIFFLWGAAGTAAILAGWFKRGARSGRVVSILARVWVITAVLVLCLFWGIGARAFSRDVHFIESEMVEVSRWIEENTDQEDLIAAHDIGALGYFSGRRIVDLAGLVTPVVIPFIRDEERLASYLDERSADYLVTFPGWYPDLTANRAAIYRTEGEVTPSLGDENMAVFVWKRSE
ncbi:MAG TPA: hypothetical protein VJ768_07705 [Anaerolineales bacterium]|nr:hypothetical protein [Anaerolineales bacterium]